MPYTQFLAILLPFLFANLEGEQKSQRSLEKEWELVWSDEFEYEGLPDETKWSYESGFVRGFESQFYTVSRAENAYVKNGYLTILAKREKFSNPFFVSSSSHLSKAKLKYGDKIPNHVRNQIDSLAFYTSASLTTLGKVSWTYGKIQIRAKFPRGAGVWPAIWMLGENRAKVGWPECGEIDIVEYKGIKPRRLYASAHYVDPKNAERVLKNQFRDVDSPPYQDFHIYSIEWDETQIKFFYDDINYHSIDNDTDTFKKPFYLLINLALGGKFGGVIDNRIFPQKFVIDYVRVYQ